MRIGIIADPLTHPDWPAIERLLEPAAKRGGVPVWEPMFALWAVYEDGLIAAATARLTADGHGEVVLLGGKGFARWGAALDSAICGAMKQAGMRAVQVHGRKGWARIFRNYRIIGQRDGIMSYERSL